jgi:hypothetical protein
MIAAVIAQGGTTLISGDMSENCEYGGVIIENPFSK